MTAILENAVVSKAVTATATDDNYKYNVAYEVGDNGKTLNRVTINAQDKDGKYAGSMNYQNTNNSINMAINAQDGVDKIVLSTMLDAVIAEIKSTLTV